MSGLDFRTIKVALADQIRPTLNAGGRTVTVRPFRTPSSPGPCLTMEITDVPDNMATFGAGGRAEFTVTLKLWVDGSDDDSREVVMDSFWSIGTGHGSSISDAVNADTTLGAVVDSCVCGNPSPPVDDEDDWYTATWPVRIVVKKIGAEV